MRKLIMPVTFILIIIYLLVFGLSIVSISDFESIMYFDSPIVWIVFVFGVVLSIRLLIELLEKRNRWKAIMFWSGFLFLGLPIGLHGVHTLPPGLSLCKLYCGITSGAFIGSLGYLITAVFFVLYRKLIKHVGI
jgi:cytochrome bd-type quinol oxidase subunit 2